MAGALKTLSSLLSRTRSAGQELRDGVEDIRSKIQKLRLKRAEVESIPATLDIALVRVDAWVDHMTHMTRKRMVEPSRFAQSQYVASDTHGYASIPDHFFVYLSPLLAETVKQQVAAVYQNTPGITEEERAQRLEAIDRDLLDAELAEESIIRAAENSGFPMMRRANASPQAVLAADEALP